MARWAAISKLTVGAAIVAAFGFGHEAIAYKIIFPYDIHEAVTRAARACVDAADGHMPTYCGERHAAMAKDSYPQVAEDYTDEEKAVRWPDDPVRAVNSVIAAPKYVSELLVGCAGRTEPESRLDEVGLTCSSHYGRYQFMHAQAARQPDGKPESDAHTREKILAWARFAYRIATEDPSLPLDGDYCGIVSNVAVIGSDLAPDGLRQCRPGRKETWRVASLFNIKCRNPWSWETCWHQFGPKPNRRAVRFAKGAILHMIQDSYSQSHVYRGAGEPPEPTAAFDARVVCGPAGHFYEYKSQEGGHHSDADAPPRLDGSCKPGAAIDDVITATAKAIWYIDGRKPEAEFIAYLEKSVLG